MSETWQIVVVVLAAGVLIEAIFLVAVMRQLGELLLHGTAPHINAPAGPKLGTVVSVPGRERSGRPGIVIFTSSECQHCEAIEPALTRMHAVYGPGAEHGHQLDVIVVLTDRNPNTRAEHARALGQIARTDLIGMMQDWNVPGTPFAVGLDERNRVKAAEVVNSQTQLEMLAAEKLGIISVATAEATLDATAFFIEHVGNGGSHRTEVVP